MSVIYLLFTDKLSAIDMEVEGGESYIYISPKLFSYVLYNCLECQPAGGTPLDFRVLLKLDALIEG